MVKIFIDPGHGGTDPGAGANSLLEKYLTLAISLRIRALLEDYENVQVKLSRDDDTTLSLKQRTDMANKWGADYLISVHINAGGGQGYEDFIYNDASSASIARQNVMHAEITKYLGMTDRGEKRGNLHMVRESKMPAILTENGFIDNAADATKLKQSSFIDKIAQGHVDGLVKIFGLKKKETAIQKEEVKVADTNTNQPSDWAKEDWERAVFNGYFDGTNPQGTLTREQAAKVINDVVDNIYKYKIEPLEKRIEELEKKLNM